MLRKKSLAFFSYMIFYRGKTLVFLYSHTCVQSFSSLQRVPPPVQILFYLLSAPTTDHRLICKYHDLQRYQPDLICQSVDGHSKHKRAQGQSLMHPHLTHKAIRYTYSLPITVLSKTNKQKISSSAKSELASHGLII